MPLSEIKRALSRPPSATPQPPPEEVYRPNPDMKNDESVETVPGFPIDVLPRAFKDIAMGCHQHLSYNLEFTAASMVGACAIALGRTHHLRWQWLSGPCLYMALVAPPGAGKSHPMAFALRPIVQRDKRSRKEYQERMAALASEGLPTDGIKKSQVLYGDFTIESLIDGLRRNQRGIAVYFDELRGWFNNFNRYNSGSEQEFWLQNWSGNYQAIDRKTSSSSIEFSDISVLGTIQPGLLDDIGKGGRAHAGFVERVLFCYPSKVPPIRFKKRMDRSADPYVELSKQWDRLLCKLMDYQILDPTAENPDERRHLLDFTEAADDATTDYMNLMQEEMDRHDNEFVRNVYSKMQTYYLRFCLILQMMHVASGEIGYDPFDSPSASGDASWIDMKIVDRAQVLTDYFLKHNLKAVSVINNVTPLAKMPSNILKWYQELPMNFTTSEAEAIGVKYQITRRSMFIYLNQQEANKRIFQKVKHGVWEKLFV